VWGRLAITAFVMAMVALYAVGAEPAQARPECGGKHAKVVGTNGRDVIKLKKRKRETVVSRGGNDRIISRGGRDRICAGKGDDVIVAGAQPDLVRGGRGDDVIYGATGADLLFGGPGRDNVFGDAGSDLVRGGRDSDRLFGGLVDDILRGSGGDDLIVGGHGGDGLAGDAGNDWLRGGANRDGFFGGPGEDTVSFATATPTNTPGGRGGVKVNLANGLATGEGPREFVLKIENVVGSPFADTLVGDRGSNLIDGGYGDDELHGLDGGDTARGGPGSDKCTDFERLTSCNDNQPRPAAAVASLQLHGPDPGLVVFGRAGEAADGLQVEAGTRNLLITADGPIVPGSNCKSVGNDVSCAVDPRRILYISMAGLSGGDRLRALGRLPKRGEVQLDGGPGNDKLTGTRGDDVLLAGPDGRDLLRAGRGSDALISETGRDVLRGGRGNDQLVTDDPCDGHVFAGGPGRGDIAGFARAPRARLRARIGGKAVDVRKARCRGTRVRRSNEILEGTRNGDVLIGTPGNDPLILGGAGSDRLIGRGGDDLLLGENGRDAFFGGKGRDVLKAKDGRRDLRLDCGPGSDYVKRDGIDPPPKRCRPPKEQLRERRQRRK
jgi:Ca2+-binding RTX toxin-like protein